MSRTGPPLLVALCLAAPGCSTTHYNFDLANRSDRTITIEIVDAIDGRPTPARRAVLGPGGHYIENIEYRTPGMTRSLRIAAAEDDSVQPLRLDLPRNQVERHDVLVADGRILLKGREP